MTRIRNVHVVGIGGCGMSAIARILYEKGYHVTGSDLRESVNTMRLKDLKIPVFFRHRAGNLRSADLVTYSPAIPPENVEMIEAKTQNIPLMGRAEMLGWIANQAQYPISVSGTHGKTTTTSMISLLFDQCGLNPTFLIGENNDVGGNAKLGKSRYLIVEADESDGAFTKVIPKIFVLTNLDADHLDYYGSLEKIIKTFFSYIEKLPEETLLVTHSDHAVIQDLIEKLNGSRRIVTYGQGEGAMIRADQSTFQERQSQFKVYEGKKELGTILLNVPGEQNIMNALAALAVGREIGLDLTSMSRALEKFVGARRRFQPIGSVNDILIFDDYAHHPTEIAYTLQAAKLGWPGRRVVAVFQPHRFTRTAFMAEDFGRSFHNADLTIVSNVYSAGEERMPGVTGNMICKAIGGETGMVIYIAKKERIPDHLLEVLRPGDLLVTMGAGDIHTVGKETLHRLREQVLQPA